ncbi:uncharacterized protein EV154DRAFT_476665 [Mucor mucedo]|uniref:uncharacterized protein n=1 Tax=Mucor mucedo TaxID=29922 RepID=UPI00221EBE62|nr:uncharacterized protein EV154DRAFT_476665 [Mucor mucedo]KAI7896300.1 hypothetical protein EV154DRAFT_476665 [Mucor mucedo]
MPHKPGTFYEIPAFTGKNKCTASYFVILSALLLFSDQRRIVTSSCCKTTIPLVCNLVYKQELSLFICQVLKFHVTSPNYRQYKWDKVCVTNLGPDGFLSATDRSFPSHNGANDQHSRSNGNHVQKLSLGFKKLYIG